MTNKKTKKKPFDEELWELFQDIILAGEELKLSIVEANWDNVKRFGHPTPNMRDASEAWEWAMKQYREWRAK